MIKHRENILNALKKDASRRYISISRLQSDGRLELDKACLNILNPKDQEEFFIINDHSSIIIVREPLEIHKDKIISKAIYKSNRRRLVLNQLASRILLCCKVGIKAFKYNTETALEIEPYIETPHSFLSSNINNIDDLAPFILRSSRSVLHVDVFDRHQKINHSGITFRILGEYWLRKYHQEVTDPEFKSLECTNVGCIYCKDLITYPISKNIIWFPIIAYEQNHYARPGLISFHWTTRNTSTTPIYLDLKVDCKEWAKKCGTVEQYFKRGIIDYTGDKLYKIETNKLGDVEVNLVTDIQTSSISMEENGLMRLALKELMDTVTNYKP